MFFLWTFELFFILIETTLKGENMLPGSIFFPLKLVLLGHCLFDVETNYIYHSKVI